MDRYILGWFLVTFSYFATLLVSANVWGLLLGGNRPFGIKPFLFRTLVAVSMLIISYVIAGIYARRSQLNRPPRHCEQHAGVLLHPALRDSGGRKRLRQRLRRPALEGGCLTPANQPA